MLRRQGLPPSCPHPEKWLVPVELTVSLLPGRTGRMGFTDIGQLRFMTRRRRSGRHQRRKPFPPPWNIAPAPASPFMRKSEAGPKGGFKKAGHRASLRAVRVEGTTDLLRRQRDSRPLAAGGASFFTPRRRQFRHKPDTCGQFLKLEMRPQEDHTFVRARIPGILAHVHAGLTQRIARLDVVPRVVGEQDILADPVIQIL